MKSKFLIKMKKLIAGKYFSTFQSIFKWSGLEVTDVRKYSAGDPFKYINRKQTAKHNELYTSLFQQEKDITLDVFFDVNYNRKGKQTSLPLRSLPPYQEGQTRDEKNQSNYEKVSEFFADMMVYCKKNGIRAHIFYPSYSRFSSNAIIKEIVIDKHREKAYQRIEELQWIVKRMSKSYRTALSQFLNLAKTNTKRRAVVIFSDFLDVEENELHLLKHFDKEHALGLIQIPVPVTGSWSLCEWQNYSYFLLDQNKELDSKKLQTIQL